jgi:hypothetical protein
MDEHLKLHAHDSRKCCNPGCPNSSEPGLIACRAGGKVQGYCSMACLRSHADLVARHAPDLRPES